MPGLSDGVERYLAELGGLRYCMIVSLPAPPGDVRRVMWVRSEGAAFTERDRQVAALAVVADRAGRDHVVPAVVAALRYGGDVVARQEFAAT